MKTSELYGRGKDFIKPHYDRSCQPTTFAYLCILASNSNFLKDFFPLLETIMESPLVKEKKDAGLGVPQEKIIETAQWLIEKKELPISEVTVVEITQESLSNPPYNAPVNSLPLLSGGVQNFSGGHRITVIEKKGRNLLYYNSLTGDIHSIPLNILENHCIKECGLIKVIV